MSNYDEKFRNFLFYKYDNYRRIVEDKPDFICEKVPKYIIDNLRYGNLLREYQEEAFKNFIAFYNDNLGRLDFEQKKNLDVVFHMATGSGKTLIMAGLILYLYKEKGYRNFLFFVNRNQILEKTKENLVRKTSGNYLFNEKIFIDDKEVLIKEVSNFNYIDNDSINICFTTIHELANRIFKPIENALTIQSLKKEKVVMIADESHHYKNDIENIILNDDDIKYIKGFDAKEKDKKTKEDKDNKAWFFVINECMKQRDDNILLEFSATCNIDNEKNKIEREYYRNKIIYNYPLLNFQKDGYSKELRTFKTPKNLEPMDRALIACVFNEFRQIVFNKFVTNKICKPVILFKSQYSNEGFKKSNPVLYKKTSKYNMELFINYIKNLTINKLKDVFNIKNDDRDNHYIEYILNYFERNNIPMST